MKILVTGAAGFIGFHTCLKLINEGHEVFGIDNINDYYNPQLKYDRLKELGFEQTNVSIYKTQVQSSKYKQLRFSRIDLIDNEDIDHLFKQEQFNTVCHLAAQAGVRYSIENPHVYISSNIFGFLNILESCRIHKVNHLVYASSSSVYGENEKVPFDTNDKVDFPISLYAATKKSNELMAHTYGHLYGFKTTGLRFFTVYGPWGRPDMAYYLFTEAISKNDPIKVFNNGQMERDFTYIDDIVNCLVKIIEKNIDARVHYKIYNIGNNKTKSLHEFITVIEHAVGKAAIKEMLPIQAGDVPKTFANIDDLKKDYNYTPKIDITYGLINFVEWYKNYNGLS